MTYEIFVMSYEMTLVISYDITLMSYDIDAYISYPFYVV